MKKIALLLVLFLTFVITTAHAQTVHGFGKITHTNNIYTDQRDGKNIDGEVLFRIIPYQNPNFGFLGYVNTNDSTSTLAGGVGFLASENLRFDLAAGVEIDPGNSSKNGIFIGRMWTGDQYNDLWGNLWAGERVRYQLIYAHNFTEWLGVGFTAEDQKGQGLYVSISPLEKLTIFSKAFHNGKNSEKKLGFNLFVDIGASLVF